MREGEMSPEMQRSRIRLGADLGSTDPGHAISEAVDLSEQLGYGLRVLATGKVTRSPATAGRR